MCFNCKLQGKMLLLRVFTKLANQKVVVLLMPVISPLCDLTYEIRPSGGPARGPPREPAKGLPKEPAKNMPKDLPKEPAKRPLQ